MQEKHEGPQAGAGRTVVLFDNNAPPRRTTEGRAPLEWGAPGGIKLAVFEKPGGRAYVVPLNTHSRGSDAPSFYVHPLNAKEMGLEEAPLRDLQIMFGNVWRCGREPPLPQGMKVRQPSSREIAEWSTNEAFDRGNVLVMERREDGTLFAKALADFFDRGGDEEEGGAGAGAASPAAAGAGAAGAGGRRSRR